MRMQFYETTIYNDDLTASFSVLTIPGRSLSDVYGFITSLPADHVQRIDAQDSETAALLLLIGAASGISDANIPDRALLSYLSKPEYSELPRFAWVLFNRASIPFERSPLAGLSLEKILRAGPETIGAAAGWFAVGDHGPFLLLAVPTGILICVAAKEAGAGIGEGLRYQIVKALTGKEPSKERDSRKRSKRKSDPPART